MQLIDFLVSHYDTEERIMLDKICIVPFVHYLNLGDRGDRFHV